VKRSSVGILSVLEYLSDSRKISHATNATSIYSLYAFEMTHGDQISSYRPSCRVLLVRSIEPVLYRGRMVNQPSSSITFFYEDVNPSYLDQCFESLLSYLHALLPTSTLEFYRCGIGPVRPTTMTHMQLRDRNLHVSSPPSAE
jgi:hypothetical protein